MLQEKNATERELEALAGPISVIAECLTMRDGRLGSEITYDEADTEIKNKLVVLENNQRLLAESAGGGAPQYRPGDRVQGGGCAAGQLSVGPRPQLGQYLLQAGSHQEPKEVSYKVVN